MTKVSLAFPFLYLFLLSSNAIGQEDSALPELKESNFSPTTVNVSEGKAIITATIRATDDLRGVNSVLVGFISPSKENRIQEFIHLKSGVKLDGIYQGELTVEQYSKQGTWLVELVQIRENAGSIVNINTEELATKGFPTELVVNNEKQDMELPSLLEFDFTPKTVNVSEGNASIITTVRATDDLRGVNSVLIGFISPNKENRIQEFIHLKSGDELDGIYQGELTVEQYSEQGTWLVELVQIRENAGSIVNINTEELAAKGFPTELVVNNEKLDVEPPSLLEFDFTPKTVNVSEGNASITATIRASDDLRGVNSVLVGFISPNKENRIQEFIHLKSGDELDGIYEGVLTVEQYSEQGIWLVELVQIRENAGSIVNIKTQELAAKGFSTDLLVTNVKDSSIDIQLNYPAEYEKDVEILPTFIWNDVDKEGIYNFQISLNEDFSNIIYETSTSNTSMELPQPLLFNTEYWWRVRFTNGDYQYNWSESRMFTTNILTDISYNEVFGELIILQPYPNPCSSKITIRYSLPKNTSVSLEILDLTNRNIILLSAAMRPKGWHELILDVKNLVKGLNIIKITTSEGSQCIKFIVI